MNDLLASPAILSISEEQSFPFGNGLVRVLFDTPDISCGMFVLPEGENGSTDFHERAIEIALVVKGEVEYIISGEKYHIHAGQGLYIPPKHAHEVGNVGKGEAIVYWLFVPNDHVHGGTVVMTLNPP